MGANLIEQLRQVEDFRTLDGRRHSLWLVLLFVIMGTREVDMLGIVHGVKARRGKLAPDRL
jgi:hypothetical protein